LESQKSVLALELLDDKITALGCEFVSRAIHPKSSTNINILKLDHNEFGAEGLRRLSEGMAINKTIE
jgi:hypothetical protein